MDKTRTSGNAPVEAAVIVEPGRYANRFLWFPRVLALLREQPALTVSVGYLLLALIGLWSSYWFYRGFGIAIIEYYEVSDFLIAGLRDPYNLLALVGISALMAVAYAPALYELRSREKVAEYRRRWWGRIVFPGFGSPFRLRRWYDMSNDGIITFAIFLGAGALMIGHAEERVASLVAGGGKPVRVTLLGHVDPLQGQARVLGTSTDFVFLYWPSNGRTEAVAKDTLGRIEMLPRQRPVEGRTAED